MDIFASFSIAVLAAIKTVTSSLVWCQQTTLNDVCFCAATKLLNKFISKIFDISLLNVLQCLLLSPEVKNKYSMTGHIVQGGAV
jgi:hypothetical protein